MKFRKQKIIIDGLSLIYYTIGRGDPVLFLHGGRTRALTYKKNLELLSNKFRIIAPDIPLFGDSSMPDFEWNFEDFANFFDKFLKKIEIKKPVVIGYSFGGGVAFNLAAINKNISKLVLVNAAGQAHPSRTEISKLLQRIVFYLLKPQYFSIFYNLAKDYVISSAKNFSNLREIERIRKKALLLTYDNLNKISAPTLILWSKDDTIFPIETARKFNEEINKSKLEIVDGNHEWILLNPKLFYKKVIEFCG